MVKISHQLPHIKFSIGEGPKSSYMFGGAYTESGLILVNMDIHWSVTESHPNLVFKFGFLKGLDEVNIFNVIGVDEVKYI